MAITAKTWIRAVVSTTGAVVGGPTGTIIGAVLGAFLASVLPGASTFAGDILRALTTRSIISAGENITNRLTPQEKKHINHDLQTAFRDALREAVYDIGGTACFPKLTELPERDVPREVVFPHTPTGEHLWHNQDPLAIQVKDLLQGFEVDLESEQILPFNPPADQPAANAKEYLEAETPDGLAHAFFEQNITPYLARYKSLIRELPGIETHLRKYLFPRTMVHLAEFLKHRTPTWRAYNRMVLETLQTEIARVSDEQTEIIKRLEALVAKPDSTTIADWSDGMADLIGSVGKIELEINEGFEELATRIVNQHRELLVRFDQLSQIASRIETKVDRVLRFLNNGQYIIEGQATVPIHRPPARGISPFMGLQSFSEQNSDLFFGREHLVSIMVARLHTTHFLAVIGASGSGKSSLVQAGVIPVLKGVRVLPEVPNLPPGSTIWPVRTISPTEHPLRALATSLSSQADSLEDIEKLAESLRQDSNKLDLAARRVLSREGGEQLLLVVDQFEELFTLCQDAVEQQAFIDNLLHTAAPKTRGVLTLIIILRADFYSDCSRFDNLRSAMVEQQEYISPMNEEELLRAIERPAEQYGWKFEPGLVDLLVHDVGNEPGALPLLSNALLETWRHRSSHTMTLESYAEMGGVKGAIAKTAEMIYNQGLTPDQQVLARNIFLRLTNVTEGSKGTRRRASLEELVPNTVQSGPVEQVLELLTDARLITMEEGCAELAHEAIIQEWPKLRSWLKENQAGLRIHHRLTEGALEWNRAQRDEGLLYRGIRLDEAVDWRKENENLLNELEQIFLISSLDFRYKEAAEKEAQQKRELEAAQKLTQAEKQSAEDQGRTARQLRRRALFLTAALAVAGILAILAGYAALDAGREGKRANQNAALAQQNAATAQAASMLAVAQQATAEAERSQAEHQKKLAQAGQLAAQSQSALLENYPQRSILLAIEANRLLPSQPDSQAFQVKNALWQSVLNTGGEKVASHGSPIGALAASPDGHWLASTGLDSVIRLWDIKTGNFPLNTAHALDKAQTITSWLAFTPDNRSLISTHYNGKVYIWDLTAEDPNASPRILAGHKNVIITAAISRDGRWLVTGSDDKTARLWDLASPDPAATARIFTGNTGLIYSVAISADNHWMATGGEDHIARLWNLTALDPSNSVIELKGHDSHVFTVAFSPDSLSLVTTSQDKTARLWNLNQADPLQNPIVLRGHGSFVINAVFSPDGRWLVTGSGDQTARRWDLKTPDPNVTSVALRGHTNLISALAISQDGRWLITASLDNTARIWDLAADDPNLSPVVLHGHDSSISALAISSDSKYVYTGSDDETIRRWELSRPEPSPIPIVLRGHSGAVGALAFTPDGKMLASGASDQTTRLYDMVTNQYKITLTGQQKTIYALGISPNGNWLVTTSFDHTANLYNLLDADPTTSTIKLQGFLDFASAAAFSPDNRWLVVGSKDGTARMYNLAVLHSNPEPATILKGQDQGVSFLAFHPDGKWLVTAAWEGKLRVWDLTAPDPAAAPVILSDCNGPVVFSPDGKWLASDCFDNKINLWRMPDLTAAPISLDGLGGDNYALAFSSDSHWMAAGGMSRTVWLWDLTVPDPSKGLHILRGHTGRVTSLAISPDNQWLASASEDQTIRLWNLASSDPEGQSIPLHGHTGKVNSLVFSPDDHWLASGSDDQTVRLWTMQTEDLVSLGCRLAGRNLIPSEWEQYFYHLVYHKTCP